MTAEDCIRETLRDEGIGGGGRAQLAADIAAELRRVGMLDRRPSLGPQPWQCPACKTWMAWWVREHRCAADEGDDDGQ